MNNTFTIINFVRGQKCHPDGADVVEPVRQNIKVLNKLGLNSTFLLQYDTLFDKEILSLVKNAGDLFEIGGWLEIVEPLVTDAGEEWKGRSFWDHFPCYSFTVGYKPDVRQKIIDTYMQRFRDCFGKYPTSVGAWLIDSISAKYLYEVYGVKAICICREQCGTDGYTLWGGYYNHAYYPSEKNMLSPAQTTAQQINVPVFRMLGSDPIRQYTCGLIDENGRVNPSARQTVCTLEPSCNPLGGGNKEWVDWFFNESFSEKGLGFAYAQIGQESSFGWNPDLEKALTYQYKKCKEAKEKGLLDIVTLSQAGDNYKKQFTKTPAFSMDFEDKVNGKDTRSIWYYNIHYRINIIKQGNQVWIRDMHLFDENQREYYYDNVTTDWNCVYKTLPLMDGYNFSVLDKMAGGFFTDSKGFLLSCSECTASAEPGTEQQSLCCKTNIGVLNIVLSLFKAEFSMSDSEFVIMLFGLANVLAHEIKSEKLLSLSCGGFNYYIALEKGAFSKSKNGEIIVQSENGKIVFSFT